MVPPLEKIAFKFYGDIQRSADVYLRWGFDLVNGKVVRGFAGLELEVQGWRFTVLHYDNSHGQQFHRHSPGFPHSDPDKTDLSHWQSNVWIPSAKDEIKANWRRWVNSVVPNDVIGYIASQGATGPSTTAPWDENED